MRLRNTCQPVVSIVFALAVCICVPSGRAAALESGAASAEPAGAITAVWANTGEDKVTQDELRGHDHSAQLISSAWDGRRIRVFGARNEMVAFNLVLEAGTSKPADAVSVEFRRLSGPDDFVIASEAASGDG